MNGWQVVHAATVRRGDKVSMRTGHREVIDMVTLPRNRKRLIFDDGAVYHLGPRDSLYVYRDALTHHTHGDRRVRVATHDPRPVRGELIHHHAPVRAGLVTPPSG